MPPTLCIFNERAGPNLSPHERAALFSQLEVKLGAIQLAVTQASAEVEPLLWEAILRGAKRVIALGGDGTVHHLVGALMRIRTAGEPHALPAFGVLPLGTGCDWSRGIGQPLGRAAALAWLARATPQPIDIGELHTDNAQAFFLNIASCGLAGEVSRRAQSLRRKRAWTYLALTLRALHSFQRPQLSVAVDGRRWFEGRTALLACCNGSHFGRGMRIAPNAAIRDGLLEILLARRLNHFELLRLSPSAFLGQSFGRGALLETRGREIRISSAHTFHYEMDGEAGATRSLDIRLHPGALNALLT